MLTDILANCAGLSVLKPSVISTGLLRSFPLSESRILDGLDNLAERFPTLGNPNQVEDGFVLKNDEPDPAQYIRIRVEERKAFELFWGPEAPFNPEEAIRSFYESIESDFSVGRRSVDLMDFRFFLTTEWEGNHYVPIISAFFDNSPITNGVEREKSVLGDLKFETFINEGRFASVGVTTNVIGKEVRRGSFSQDLLRAFVGVAQDSGFEDHESLQACFDTHSEVAVGFMNDYFLPSVVEPLDAALREYIQEVDKIGEHD